MWFAVSAISVFELTRRLVDIDPIQGWWGVTDEGDEAERLNFSVGIRIFNVEAFKVERWW